MKRHVFLIALICCGVAGIWCVSTIHAQPPSEAGFVYEDHGKRDPFWPLVSPAGTIVSYEKVKVGFQSSDLKLEGIIYEPRGESLAIINGQIVKEKDQLGPATIVTIDRNSVILNADNKKFELKLEKEE